MVKLNKSFNLESLELNYILSLDSELKINNHSKTLNTFIKVIRKNKDISEKVKQSVKEEIS